MILLTGAHGFLGKYISKAIAPAALYTLARSNADLNVDITQAFELPDRAFDQIIHAAGKAHTVPQNPEEEQLFFEVNVKGTAHLLAALEELPQKPKAFVFISSVAVYGLESGKDIRENQALSAQSAYGRSKIIAEKLVQDWCRQHQVTCTILRLPLLIGTDAPGNLHKMQLAIEKGRYFNISGTKAEKSMALAEDVARAIIPLSAIGGIYHLTDGIHPTFQVLSAVMAKQAGRKPPLSIPLFMARLAAFMNKLLPFIPLDADTLQKVTSPLTFNDDKARETGLWHPRPVLDFYR